MIALVTRDAVVDMVLRIMLQCSLLWQPVMGNTTHNIMEYSNNWIC